MEKEIQDKAREKIIGIYEERSFDCLVQYTYWGGKYANIEKQMNEYADRIRHFEGVVQTIRALPDHHAKENRSKIDAAQKDIDSYKERIKRTEPLIKKLQENAVKWQQQGVEYLELVETARDFKMRTPQEIEDSKKVEAGQPEDQEK